MDDAREQLHGRVVDLIVLDEHLERAESVAVGVLGPGRVVGVRTLAFSNLEHLIGRHVEELGVRVDEVLISQGQAIRSVFGRSRVTHFMVNSFPISWR